MRKIRIGNDFAFIWVIERNGQPEDLDLATDKRVVLSSAYGKQEVAFSIIDGNKVRIEFTPLILDKPADYNLLLTYTLIDAGAEDGDLKCAVDIDAFTIVSKTAKADLDVDEFTSTSEIGIGLKGDKGDSAFVVWQSQAGNEGKTEQDFFDYLQEPAVSATNAANQAAILANTKAGLANDAADLANQKADKANTAADNANQAVIDAAIIAGEWEVAEGERVIAEGERLAAENLRIGDETSRGTAEGLRDNAEGVRDAAEIIRLENEIERQIQLGLAIQATEDANDAAELANTKAGLANDAAIAADEARALTEAATLSANNAVGGMAGEFAKKVDKETGKSLIADIEIEKLSKVDLVTEKITPIDADSVGLWDSVVNKFVRTKLSDFKTFLGLTFEKLSNKKSVMNPLSETDYLNSKGIADYVASVTKNENWVGVEIDPTLSCSEPAPKSTVEAYKATELKRTGNLYFHKSGNSRIFNAIRPAIVNRATKQIAWYLDKDDPSKKADGSISSPDWAIHNICIVIPDIYRRIRIVNNVSGRYEVALDIEPFAGATLDYPMSAHSIGFATVDRTAVPNQLVSVISQDERFRGGNNNAVSDLLPSTQLGKPATSISRINFENYAENAGWETGNISDRTLWHELTALYFANTNIQLDFTAALTAEGYPQGGNGAGVTTWNSERWAAKNGRYPLHNIGEGFMTVGCQVGVKEMVDTKYYVGKVSSLVAGELIATDQFKTASAWSDTYIGYTVQNLQTLDEATIISKTDDNTLILSDDIFTDSAHWFWIKGVEFSYQIPVFFGLEHLYGEIWDWVSGVNIEKSANVENGGTGLSKAYVCTDFSKRSATITPDYQLLGLVPRQNGYIKELYRDFVINKNVGAGSNTYMSDYGYYENIPATGTGVYGLLFGASATHGVYAGVRVSHASLVPAHSHTYFGARLRAKIG